MADYKTAATRIQQLMDEGKTLEQALAETGVKTPGSTRPVIEDRISWIKGLTNISELRKAIKVAHAKRSKARGTDKEGKYVDEIEAGQVTLNGLLAQVNTAENPVAKALELGEEEGSVLQLFIQSKEQGLEDDLKAKFKECGFSAAESKQLTANASVDTPDDLKQELLALGSSFLTSYEERAAKMDQRVRTLNRRWGLLHSDAIQPNVNAKPATQPKETKKAKSGKKA